LIDYPNDLGCTSPEDRDEYNAPVCSDECSPEGKQECSGDYLITCGNFDSDSCLEWSNPVYCIYGCSNGVCNNPPPVNETQTQCNDSIDNDGDRLIDYPNDPGCTSPDDDDEYNVPVPVNTCTDTDYGYNVLMAGTVSGYLNGEAYSYTDSCADSATLVEHYCGADGPVETTYPCAYANNMTAMTCINGACQ
jgi:hypothetical protein